MATLQTGAQSCGARTPAARLPPPTPRPGWAHKPQSAVCLQQCKCANALLSASQPLHRAQAGCEAESAPAPHRLPLARGKAMPETRLLNDHIMRSQTISELQGILSAQMPALEAGKRRPFDAVNVAALASRMAKIARAATPAASAKHSAELGQALHELQRACAARAADMAPRQLASCMWALGVLGSAQAQPASPHHSSSHAPDTDTETVCAGRGGAPTIVLHPAGQERQGEQGYRGEWEGAAMCGVASGQGVTEPDRAQLAATMRLLLGRLCQDEARLAALAGRDVVQTSYGHALLRLQPTIPTTQSTHTTQQSDSPLPSTQLCAGVATQSCADPNKTTSTASHGTHVQSETRPPRDTSEVFPVQHEPAEALLGLQPARARSRQWVSVQHEPAEAQLLGAMRRHMAQYNPQDCSLAVWAWATLSVRPSDAWLGDLCRRTAQLGLCEFTNAGLAKLAWSLATMRYTPSAGWSLELLRASLPRLGSLSHQELSNLAWAVPCLLGRDAPTHSQGHTSPPLATSAVLQQWLVAVECELTQRLQAASVHGSADVSLQSDSVHTASLAQADTQHLHGGAVQGSTCAYVQTDTAGLVQRGTGASVLTGTVSTTGAEAQLRPQAVACILRCLALLDHSPLAALYDALYSVVTADGSQHSMGALAARATGAAPDTVTGRTRYVQRRSEEAAWATDMQALCITLWSLGRMGGYPPVPLIECLMDRLGSRLHRANTADLTSALYALAQLKHPPGHKWLLRFFQASRELVPQCSPPQLSSLLLALAHLRIRPDRGWMEFTLSHVTARVTAFLAQHTSSNTHADETADSAVLSSGTSNKEHSTGGGGSGDVGASGLDGRRDNAEHSKGAGAGEGGSGVVQSERDGSVWQCTPRELASLWGALGQLDYCPPRSCFQALCLAAACQLHAFTAKELTILVTTQAKLLTRGTVTHHVTHYNNVVTRLPGSTPPPPITPARLPLTKPSGGLPSHTYDAASKGEGGRDHGLVSARQGESGKEVLGVPHTQAGGRVWSPLDRDSLGVWVGQLGAAIAAKAGDFTPSQLSASLNALARLRATAGLASFPAPPHEPQALSRLHASGQQDGAYIGQGRGVHQGARVAQLSGDMSESVSSSMSESVNGHMSNSVSDRQLIDAYGVASLCLLTPGLVVEARLQALRVRSGRSQRRSARRQAVFGADIEP